MDFESLGKQLVSNYLFCIGRDSDIEYALWDIIVQWIPCGYRSNGFMILDGEFKDSFTQELMELV